MMLYGRGAAAGMLGVHPDTLIRWEKKGYVKPQRDSAGRRLFTPAQIEGLREIVKVRVKQKLISADALGDSE